MLVSLERNYKQPSAPIIPKIYPPPQAVYVGSINIARNWGGSTSGSWSWNTTPSLAGGITGVGPRPSSSQKALCTAPTISTNNKTVLAILNINGNADLKYSCGLTGSGAGGYTAMLRTLFDGTLHGFFSWDDSTSEDIIGPTQRLGFNAVAMAQNETFIYLCVNGRAFSQSVSKVGIAVDKNQPFFGFDSGSGMDQVFLGGMWWANYYMPLQKALAWTRDSWRAFSREIRLSGIASNRLYQYSRPSGNTALGSWLSSGGGAATYANIDEVTQDDGDYNYTETATDTARFSLSTVYDPQISSDHTVSYAVKGSGTVYLMCGATEIANWVHSGVTSVTRFNQSLSGSQIDAITDYSTLELKLIS